jgi:hypothetical protein
MALWATKRDENRIPEPSRDRQGAVFQRSGFRFVHCLLRLRFCPEVFVVAMETEESGRYIRGE